MKPLIDADMLVYEAGFGCEDRETGEVFSFDYAAALVDRKIAEICAAVGATEPPALYLTGKNNFRFGIAKTKPYKSGRGEKPFHYENIRQYLLSLGAVLVDGMEADDQMAMDQTDSTVICTRDKDLRQVEGWHYGWEHGLQPEFPLQLVDKIGDLELIEKPSGKTLKGTGLKFFYSQLITGDDVDSIPGLPRGGPVLAYNTLSSVNTEGEMFEAVRELYRKKYEEKADERLLEQGQLLWMCRETKDGGQPVLWELPRLP